MAAADSRTHDLHFPDSEPGERWLPVVDWENLYAVSDFGRVRGLDRVVTSPSRWGGTRQWLQRGRILKQAKHGAAGKPRVYRAVVLQRDSEAVNASVHRLVLEAFDKPCPEGMECCHGPGGPSDNRLVNLSWDTRAKNLGPDRVRDGTDFRGDRGTAAKLSAADVEAIRSRSGAGERGVDLAAEYGVHPSTISAIATGSARPFDGSPQSARSVWRGKLTDEQVAEIRERYVGGEITQQQLATEFRVSRSLVSQITAGTTRTRPQRSRQTAATVMTTGAPLPPVPSVGDVPD